MATEPAPTSLRVAHPKQAIRHGHRPSHARLKDERVHKMSTTQLGPP